MSYFNIVAQSSESTVVTEYKPQAKRSEAYQSEADLEKEFIRLLCELGYERLTIHKEADLIANLRVQLEKLNSYHFTDMAKPQAQRRQRGHHRRYCLRN